ncbi:poly(A)-binding protein binding protein [Coemansia erecta]|nr:poly(A)-binding protein binding protein [Coemansia sp. RSA 2618]KAJ2828905.1 poly(A)-binding protein binding protein [Coemansia erecta]
MALFNDKARNAKTSGDSNGQAARPNRWTSGPPQFNRPQRSSPVNNRPPKAQSPAPPAAAAASASAAGGGRSFSSVASNNGTSAAQASTASPRITAQAKARAAPSELIEGEAPDQVETMHTRLLYLLAYLVGMQVKVTTTSGDVYHGVLCSINPNDAQSVVLRYAYIQSGGKAAPPIDTLVIPGDECLDISGDVSFADDSGIDGLRAGFKTDTDISRSGAQAAARELHRWVPDASDDLALLDSLETVAAPGTSWDQFATNEQLFGLTTDFDEEIYTTKLDRTRADFKERERQAIRIAQEIQSTPFLNAHVAEERQELATIDDASMDEEDRYGAVLRPSGAPGKYVPPYLRGKSESPAQAKPGAAAKGGPEKSATETAEPAAQPNNAMAAAALAKLNIQTSCHSPVPGAAELKLHDTAGTPISAASPNLAADPAITALSRAPTAPANNKLANLRGNKHRTDVAALTKPMADITEKLNSERERIHQHKQALLKTRVSELVKFHQSFKLPTPMPDDIAEMVGAKKKGDSQQAGSSASSPSPDAEAPVVPDAAELVAAKSSKGEAKSVEAKSAESKAAVPKAADSKGAVPKPANSKPAEAKPVEPKSVDSKPAEPKATDAKPADTKPVETKPAKPAVTKPAESPAKSDQKKSSFKFNTKASSFKPSAGASPFVPKLSASSSRASSSTGFTEFNVFFGRRSLKKAPLPLWGGAFKLPASPASSDDAPTWPFGSRTYRSQFVPEEPEAMMYPPQGYMPQYGYGYYPQYQQVVSTPEMGPAMIPGQTSMQQPPPHIGRSGSDSPNIMYSMPPVPPMHMGMVPPPMPFSGMHNGGYMGPSMPPPQGYPPQSMPMSMGYVHYPPAQPYGTSPPPPGMVMMHSSPHPEQGMPSTSHPSGY